MTLHSRETAFQIAQRINQVIDELSACAQKLGLPVSPEQARLIYARCVQSTERKWIGAQHYTINIEKTIENLAFLTPPELARLTQRTVRDGMELIYHVDTEPEYAVTPTQLQNLHHPDASVYRLDLATKLEQRPELSRQRKLHHQRLLQRLDYQPMDQATELHRAVMALPLREAIPGTASRELIDDLIQLLSNPTATASREHAIMLHDLANHRHATE